MTDAPAAIDGNLVLFRQINPAFVKDGQVSSAAFRPTPKDDKQLSVDCQTLQSAEGSYQHFTADLGFDSVGTMGVTRDQVAKKELEVTPSPLTDNAAHHLIDFNPHGGNAIKRKAQALRNDAVGHGFLFSPET